MKTIDVIKKAVEALKGPMEFHPRQIIISEEVLNIIAADILGQQREIEKLKDKLAISKSIARHYRKDARVLLKEQQDEIYALQVELASADELAEGYAELLKEQKEGEQDEK